MWARERRVWASGGQTPASPGLVHTLRRTAPGAQDASPLLPVLEEVHLQVEVRVIERHTIEIAKAVPHLFRIGALDMAHRLGAHPLGGLHPLEQRLVVRALRAQEEAQLQLFQLLDMGTIRGQRILHHHQLQMRMLAAHIAQQPFRRVALAVVLARPIALQDRLGRQGQHYSVLRMHQHRTQHLMIVRRAAIAVMLLATALAMHIRRGEVARPIDREQIMPVHTGEPFQCLAALQQREHTFERGSQLPRRDPIQTLA